MAPYRSEFLRRVDARGFVHQLSEPEKLDALLAAKRTVAYIGFDCTGPSLHVGSLVGIMLLRHFQQAGHKPIVLMGGGTTKVGDPSGKDDTRKLLTEAEIAANMASIRRVFANFLEFGQGPTDAIMANNADWLDRLEYIPFLREVGRHFSVNRMLDMDSVKLRLEREQPLSFLEFNYMVLQAYDFLELARRHGCALQMGGSDQWGNIVTGIDLARRVEGRELFALTTPLIATAGGAKMGKTASGAVWLNGDMLSPYDYWQYWRNTHDADVGRFLRLFTELPMDEVARLETLEGDEINAAKIALADAATTLCHGRAAAESARETARRTFEEGGAGDDLPSLDLPRAELEQGLALIDLLMRAGLAASKGEARRLVRGGGARVNDRAVTDELRIVSARDLGPDGSIKLSAGKKRHALVKLQ
ncbi:MAG TPA: tyrosine--tRNA ligase [Alphaproteobacteria bacterium]|nr:tyrosine--tRNA ligase [Alphaproteobacteria bacterium]